jgi:hypothetical protein
MSTIATNDKIFVQEALNAFTAGLAPLNAFTRSYSAEARRKGDVIAIPRADALSTTTFAYANNGGFPYETEGGTLNTISLNLDQHQIVGVDITDIQYANKAAAEITVFARQQGRALARKCLENIFSLVSITNFGAAAVTPVSIADTGIAQLRNARKTMVDRRVNTDNLSLVASSELFTQLLADNNISQAFQYGGAEAIREGRIPRLLGMDLYETNALALGGTLSLVGFLAHPDAIAVAVRQLQPQDDSAYLAVETVVDDETGLGFTYRRHFNPGKGRHYASFECLFGFTQALTLGIGLIRKAD